MLEKVNTKIAALKNSSSKTLRSERQATNIVSIISTLVKLIESSSSVDSLGTSSVFISTTTSIIQVDTTTVTLTTVQITQIVTFQNTITGVIQTIITRITMVITMMTDIGGSSEVAGTTVTDPAQASPTSPKATTSIYTSENLTLTVPKTTNVLPPTPVSDAY
jgi:hypothetical protein